MARANPAGEAAGWTQAGIISRETELRVVAQVRGVPDFPERGHVIALGTSCQRLAAVVASLRQVE